MSNDNERVKRAPLDELLNPYENLPDERLILHIDWDSRAARVWAARHGEKSIAEVKRAPLPHAFVGSSDRWCEVCNQPDRAPIHAEIMRAPLNDRPMSSTHPDLSPLLEQGDEGRDRYTCILLAMIGGAQWGLAVPGNVNEWWLKGVGLRGTCWYVPETGRTNAKVALPNPLADTVEGRAAAWEMETRELFGWDFVDNRHRHSYQRDRYFSLWGPWRSDRKRAAKDAVLHKYQHDPRFAQLIAPLINKDQ